MCTEERVVGMNEIGGGCSQTGEDGVRRKGKRAWIEVMKNFHRQEKNLYRGDGMDGRGWECSQAEEECLQRRRKKV